jgi:hypothetical protein
VRRAALLAVAALTYVVAAWMVAPGFYDGFGPPQPYNFTCPPHNAGANQKPSSGHADIKVVGGVSDAGSAFTNDAQIVLGFLQGAFDATGKTTITIDLTPLPTCPQPEGIRFVTNVYCVTANAPLVKPVNVRLPYSNLVPPASAIYQAANPDGPWNSIAGTQESLLFMIVATTKSLGCFAAGYPSASPPPGAVRIGGGQVLPIIVAAIIVIVLLAGIPLAAMRRRRARHEVEEDEV